MSGNTTRKKNGSCASATPVDFLAYQIAQDLPGSSSLS